MESINATQGILHEVDRSHLLDCVLRLYDSQVTSIILEYPLYIKFSGEAGVDEGGVQRDICSLLFGKNATLNFLKDQLQLYLWYIHKLICRNT